MSEKDWNADLRTTLVAATGGNIWQADACFARLAEWLDRNELEIRAKPPFNFTVNLLEETKPAAQEEQP